MSHRNRIGVATALWLAVLPGVGSGQAGDTEPIKTTLCELVKEPAQFNGKFVQLRATIRHGFEVSLVVDESCSVWLAGPGTTYMSVGNVTLPVSSNSANVLWWVGFVGAIANFCWTIWSGIKPGDGYSKKWYDRAIRIGGGIISTAFFLFLLIAKLTASER